MQVPDDVHRFAWFSMYLDSCRQEEHAESAGRRGNLLEHDMSKPDDNQLPSLADIFGYETAEENEEAAADYIRKIQERDD
jgi:hypothetical protein